MSDARAERHDPLPSGLLLRRAAYSLTEAGIQTQPVMVAIGNWAAPTPTDSTSDGCVPSSSRDGGHQLIERFNGPFGGGFNTVGTTAATGA